MPYHIAPSPHEKSAVTTQKIMLAVLVALLPAALAGCFYFGLSAVLVLLTAVISAVAAEAGCRIIMKRNQTVTDGSAAVTGLLLGMNLPADMPLWQVCVGSFVAIVIVKQLFGGLGQNFANPAIVARIVLLISFQAGMTTFRAPNSDAIVSATPMVSGDASYWDLFLGNTAGCIGETCAAALLLGGIFLCMIRVILPVTPVAYLGSFALCVWLGGGDVLYQLLSGGLMLGAIFMATDYVTTPITPVGKAIFGVGCGILTYLIRSFGGYPEGVSFAILLMNLLTPYIDRFTMTKPFGAAKPVRKEAADA